MQCHCVHSNPRYLAFSYFGNCFLFFIFYFLVAYLGTVWQCKQQQSSNLCKIYLQTTWHRLPNMPNWKNIPMAQQTSTLWSECLAIDKTRPKAQKISTIHVCYLTLHIDLRPSIFISFNLRLSFNYVNVIFLLSLSNFAATVSNGPRFQMATWQTTTQCL